jgi:hypothetical protein
VRVNNFNGAATVKAEFWINNPPLPQMAQIKAQPYHKLHKWTQIDLGGMWIWYAETKIRR